MKKFGMRCAVVAVLGLAMAAFSSNTAANNLADPTIKEVMKKVNSKGGLKDSLAAAKGDNPNWDDLSAKSKELVSLAKALGENKPPKGDDESWKKLTSAYLKAAEDLDKAIASKDGKAAVAAHKGLTACGACHKVHK